MMKKLIAVLCFAAAGAGCSTGFHTNVMQEALEEDRRVFTDDLDVLKIEQLRPQIQFPIRLAVVPPARLSQRYWRESSAPTEGEREELLALGEKLKKEGVVSEFILIPEMLLDNSVDRHRAGYFKSVRIAAARLRADAVLIMRSVTDVDAYVNPLAVLDLTIVGLYLIPGHHKDALTITEGMVIDNRNQFLYFAGSAEGKGTTTGPIGVIEERDAVGESRRASMHAFGETLVLEARRARSYVPGPRYETPGK
jgi:rhombotail lipoprotein